MTDPLEIRRAPGGGAWGSLAVVALAVVGGVALTVASVAAVITQDLDRESQVQALFLVVVGVMALVWGGTQVGALPPEFDRGAVLRLTEDEVWLRIGAVADQGAASFPWTAVESVLVAPVDLPDGMFVPEDGPRQVIRFVVPDETLIRHDPLAPFDLVKATSLGLSPLAGATTLIIGPGTADHVDRVLDWIRAHQPHVPVEDTRPV